MREGALGILLSILAAASWGVAAIFTRLGLQGISPVVGTFISMAASLLIVTVIAALAFRDALLAVSLNAVAWFALIGVLNFPLGRLLNFSSVKQIGVARSSPVLAVAPFFSIAMAVLLLGESLTAPIVVGAALILGGIVLVVTSQ